ncbi:MAG: phosphatase PAP2 family protein [Eubacterium sp.]
MDLSILLWLQSHLHYAILDPIFKTITMLGDDGFIWIVLTLILLFRKDTRYAGMVMALSLAFSLLFVNIGIKPLVDRPRPYEVYPFNLIIAPPPGSSFPSAHSSASFAAAWAYFITRKNKMRYAWLVLAVAISFSRLYLFVHYPTDVLSGIALGILFSYLARFLVCKIISKKTWSWLPTCPDAFKDMEV